MGRGSTLIAILEGCHSETLLDLDTTRVFPPTGRASFSDVTNLPKLAGTRRFKTDHTAQGERGASPARRNSGPTRCRTISEYANVVSISACLDSENSNTNDKTMVHFLIELLRANTTIPLTPHMLQEQLQSRLVEEKMQAVSRHTPLTPDVVARIRKMQNPKVSTLRGSTSLLDEPLIIPSA